MSTTNSNFSSVVLQKNFEKISDPDSYFKHNRIESNFEDKEDSTFQIETKKARFQSSVSGNLTDSKYLNNNLNDNSILSEDKIEEFVVDDDSSELDEDDIIRVEGGIESSDESDDIDRDFPKNDLKRSRHKNKSESQVSELETREEVRKFIQQMNDAALSDEKSYAEGKVALLKLKMIDEVCKRVLMSNLTSHFISEGILDVLGRWLSPFHDGTLPNLSIRTKILKLVISIPLREEDITSTEMGKVICELWKNPTETSENRQMIRILIQRWVRLISKVKDSISNNRDVPTLQGATSSFTEANQTEQNTNSILHIEPRTARIPVNTGYNFKVIPRNDDPNIQSNIHTAIDKPVNNLNISWNKKNRNNLKHAMKISLEGKGL